MFRRRTLFVLGAGASAEADLPVGVGLAKIISRMLDVHPGGVPNGTAEMLLSQLYGKFPLADNGYHRAAVVISDGVRFAKSIDDFLDRQSDNENVQRVGRAAIVKSILAAERNSFFSLHPRSASTLDRLETTWYMKFFRVLGSEVTTSNVRQIFDNVAFIVFNYDRCLEYFLLNALQQTYNIPEAEALSILSDLTIIHPYGVVAGLPPSTNSVPFGGTDGFEHDHAALSSNIKIYTEQIGVTDLRNEIQVEMSRAQQIVFLGFGYLPPNLQLLGPSSPLESMPVFGTAFNFSDSDRDVVHGRLARMFKQPAPRMKPYSPIVLDNRIKCAGIFDNYSQSIAGV
jgi:hypothetical protein